MPRQISRGNEALTEGASLQPIWDLPVRLVHWAIAALIAFSWWSAENHHMDWHIWSGFGILTLLLFRLFWGVVGSSTARFANFVRGPGAIRNYMSGKWRGIGHTPMGALSVIALLGAVAAQVSLGLIAEDDDGIYGGPLSPRVSMDTADVARELHETLFNVILALVALHVAAIIFYRLRGKRLIWPMISGKGAVEPGVPAMRPGKWWVALICLGIALAITRWIVAGAPLPH